MRSKSLHALLASASLYFVFGLPARAQPLAKVGCEARENGGRASASFRVLRGDAQIASGSCGKELALPEGAYELLIQLDGALAAEQRHRVQVKAGESARPTAQFETGVLLVEITREGRRSVGLVKLLTAEREIATVSAGVESRIAIGVYSITIESRGETRRIDGVAITRGERRVLGVDLGSTPK